VATGKHGNLVVFPVEHEQTRSSAYWGTAKKPCVTPALSW